MGKASRRSRAARHERSARPAPAPFVSRPFEGLADETEWVAMREIVPAATAAVRLASGALEDAPEEITVATVLPLAWPALRRDTGEVLVGIQTGNTSGDMSRDLAQAIALASAVEPGSPVPSVPMPTADTPRLQDLIDTSAPLEVSVHEGFEFWVADGELDAEAQASLERANETAIPTVRVESARSCYWCRIADRAYVRWVLPHDEDTALTALARLHAVGESTLGGDGRLLGCFRSSGLLIPVWEVDLDADPASFAEPVAQMWSRIEDAAGRTEPLTAEERGAKAGLTNRQVTLR